MPKKNPRLKLGFNENYMNSIYFNMEIICDASSDPIRS